MIKNITLSADDIIINQARKKAVREKTSLNKLFREWVSNYANRDNAISDYDSLMKSLSKVDAGKKFSKEDLNER